MANDDELMDMGDPDRTPRSMETRDHEARPAAMWQPPTTLPVPALDPAWHFRWIRVEMMGQPDQRNVGMKKREGYEPCLASEYPDLAYLNDDARKEGLICNGGLMLCRMPKEFVNQRAAHYGNLHRQQLDGVDQSLRATNTDRRAPLLKPQRRSVVGFG